MAQGCRFCYVLHEFIIFADYCSVIDLPWLAFKHGKILVYFNVGITLASDAMNVLIYPQHKYEFKCFFFFSYKSWIGCNW